VSGCPPLGEILCISSSTQSIQFLARRKTSKRVAAEVRGSVKEPYLQVHRETTLGMLLRAGSMELGLRRSTMKQVTFAANELAESVRLSTAHFSQMFRKSTGETPHQFVLRHRIERAKEMLRVAEPRVLDVAIACGFRTQQHFARVFRHVCGTSPTEYRKEFLRYESPITRDISPQDTRSFAPAASAGKW
jgi:AraC-like DNA-binding protein